MKKRILSLVLVVCLLIGAISILASCKKDNDDDQNAPGAGVYTYNDAVIALSANWNPHTYQTADESYPISYLTTGLYGFIFNDALNPVEGKDPYAGYKIIPEMAADFPVDVTEDVKEAHPEFGIPESATEGYAYTIKLNPNATWENGEPITAETYVYSMRMLLDPNYKNYRATDYYAGSFCIAGAEFYANQGQEKNITIATVMKNENISFEEFLAKYGTAVASVNWDYSFGAEYLGEPGAAYDSDAWSGEDNPPANEVVVTKYTVAQMKDVFYGAIINDWGYPEAVAYEYFTAETYLDWTYPDEMDFANVGIYQTSEDDDYSITIVLGKALAGFNLLYSLSGNWIVYQPYYDILMKPIPNTDAYATTYNTSPSSTMSYGPYKMTSYVLDKSMTFERNENWFGYTDGKHKYVHPDGNTYDMYQTDKIYCQVVEEADTRKLMFLSGQLMTYGLQADDFAEYRDSEFCYATPSETIFFFVFNGNLPKIQEREAAEDFNKATTDLETMTLNSFRRAWAVSFDKEAFCTEISPSRSGGYGLIGNSYIYDPDTGARYRDTDQAKKALCEFYSVDYTQFESLDAAVDSITGFDVVKARELYTEAYAEAIELGYITDTNNDGKSDQTIEIVYSSSEVTSFITKTINYFNTKLNEVTVGTPFEGKIVMKDAGDLGDPAWSNNLKAGITDTCLCGWNGSALDPFGLTDLYTNPAYQYDAKWFDSTTEKLTLTIDGEELTMNLKQWSDALNGATVTVNGEEYCFGEGIADVETRLDILAAIETVVLGTYNYIPMLQDAGMSLLSKQVYYVVEEYNPIMGRGGITYLRYNYDDAQWAAYVAEQNGDIKY